jgi:CheY-like chemotaxis protein
MGDAGTPTEINIVLLDDDRPTLKTWHDTLSWAKNYTIHPMDASSQVVDFFKQGRRVDLLIADISLPGMDGPTLVSYLHDSHRRDLPVIYLTNHNPELARKGKSISTKFPVFNKNTVAADPTEFFLAIEELLRDGSNAAA